MVYNYFMYTALYILCFYLQTYIYIYAWYTPSPMYPRLPSKPQLWDGVGSGDGLVPTHFS